MSYKAVRTDAPSSSTGCTRRASTSSTTSARDPYEMRNVIGKPAYGKVRARLYRELRKLVAEAAGL